MFEEYQSSELLRTPLDELVLTTKQLGLAPECGATTHSTLGIYMVSSIVGSKMWMVGFLRRAVNPPPEISIRNAIEDLTLIGALDGMEQLTTLGLLLSKVESG